MNLNKDNYFSQEASENYMSNSQYKSFLECETKALAKIRGDYNSPQSKALLHGQYLHSWIEGKKSFEDFNEKNKDIVFSTRTKKKYKEFSDIDDIIKTLESNNNQYEKIFNYLNNEKVQKEVIITGKLFGVDWKIMIDAYCPDLGYFADLKFMQDIYKKFWSSDTGKYENFIMHYGYDQQMVIYSEIEKITFGRNNVLSPFLVIITKDVPPDTAIVSFKGSENDRKEILDRVEQNIKRIIDVKEGKIPPIQCNKCDYCRSIKEPTILKYNFEV